MNYRYLLAFLMISSSLVFAQESSENGVLAERVILIGFDGMSPDGVKNAHTPTIDAMVKQGASSMKARAVMPTSSGANWGSMLLGAGPEQHGITSNGWRVDKYEFVATETDADGFFPSIFDVVRAKYPSGKIGVFHEWETIKHLFNGKAADKVVKTGKAKESLSKALKFIKKEDPKFVFVHLDAIDHAGHTYGHGTKKYYGEIGHIDKELGKFIDGLKKEGLYDSSHIILSSDHGGKGKGHGGNSLEEILIPWVITGPHVKKGAVLQTYINTYDTPATIAYILGAQLPKPWIGRPVIEAIVK